MEGAKRSRTSNFSKYEISILLELVEKYKNIVENKKTDGVSVQQKLAAWAKIEKDFNKAPGITIRTANKLKTCFDNLKRKALSSKADARMERMKTGGGPCRPSEMNEATEHVLAILGPRATPLFNRYDADADYHGDASDDTRASDDIIDLDLPVVDTVLHSHDFTPIALSAGPACVPSEPVAGPSSRADELHFPSSSACASASASTSASAVSPVIETPAWHQRRLPRLQKVPPTHAIDSACNKRVEYLEKDLKMREKEHVKYMEMRELEKEYFQMKMKIGAEKFKYWQAKNKNCDN